MKRIVAAALAGSGWARSARIAMRLLPRAIVVAAIAGLYAAAVFTDEQPAVVAVGFAPLAWLALEAGWRLFD